MKCRDCGTENASDSRFCLSCGENIENRTRVCRACHTENSAEAKFCANCGQPLATPAGQQQPVTGPKTATPVVMVPSKSRTRIAALCVWIVSAILALLAFTAFGPYPDEMQACIGKGGSGSTCPGAHFPAQLFWVLAVLGAGYGGKLWYGRPT